MTKITNSVNDMSRGLYGQILKQMNGRLRAGLPKIKGVISNSISQGIMSDPMTAELLSGGTSRLVSVLGLDSASARIQDVVDSVISNINIDFLPFRMITGGKVSGRFNIGILNIDQVVTIPSATIISENGSYNWLEMVLKGGDKVYGISADLGHLFRPGKTFKQSRTGHGLIVEQAHTAIRVEPQWSGTKTDNWLTRALSSEEFQDKITQAIFSII